MATTIQQSFPAGAWELARRQHWVLSRDQLLRLGMTPAAIRHRLRRKLLHRLWRGVYVVGRPDVGALGRWMAATLACGPGALLSHHSAAELWALRPVRGPDIHVSVRASLDRSHRGIRLHRRPALAASDVTTFHGIPVTTPICTVIDIATELRLAELEAAINEGNKRNRFDPDELRGAVADASPHRRGVAVVRRALDRRTLTLTDSELERRFLRISGRAELPAPVTQVEVNGFRVDFFYAEIGLVVETDGLRYHRTPAQQARDRLRDQVHTAAGLTTLRFTHAQIYYEAAHVEGVLRRVHRRLLG